jgi:hypothetical protein
LFSPGTQPTAALAPGSAHALHAVLDGRVLRVWADQVLAREGEVPDDALGLRGPAGVRTEMPESTSSCGRAAPLPGNAAT